MTDNFGTKPANQDLAYIYLLIGEAICMIQHLESALSVLITLKKDVRYPLRVSKGEADNFLEKYRSSLTLGQAINLAKKNNLFSISLYSDLEAILEGRNWLVHKFLNDYLDNARTNSAKDGFFNRIKTISNEAKRLQEAIETDLIAFSESVGIDMSRVRVYMRQHPHKPEVLSASYEGIKPRFA